VIEKDKVIKSIGSGVRAPEIHSLE
jgi:hypothetical protein